VEKLNFDEITPSEIKIFCWQFLVALLRSWAFVSGFCTDVLPVCGKTLLGELRKIFGAAALTNAKQKTLGV